MRKVFVYTRDLVLSHRLCSTVNDGLMFTMSYLTNSLFLVSSFIVNGIRIISKVIMSPLP